MSSRPHPPEIGFILDREAPSGASLEERPDDDLIRLPLSLAPGHPRLPVTRDAYIAALLRLYLEQPDTPATPRRSDRATAADFHRRGIPLPTLAHAIRLATLRRHQRAPDDPPLAPIRSLAYYRRVLESLTPEDFDPGYVAYQAGKHAGLLERLRSTSPAAPGDPG